MVGMYYMRKEYILKGKKEIGRRDLGDKEVQKGKVARDRMRNREAPSKMNYMLKYHRKLANL